MLASVLAVLPVVILIGEGARYRLFAQSRRLEKRVVFISAGTASLVGETLAEAERILHLVSRDCLSSSEDRKALLVDILQDFPQYAGMATAAAGGSARWRVESGTLPEDWRGDPVVETALKTPGRLAVGGLHQDPERMRRLLKVAYAPSDATGGVSAIALATLDFGCIADLPSFRAREKEFLEEDGSITLIHRSGAVLAHIPTDDEWSRRGMAGDGDAGAVVDGERVAAWMSANTEPSLHSFQSVAASKGAIGVFVAVPVPRALGGIGKRVFWGSLGGAAVAGILLFAAVWAGMVRFLVRPVADLERTARAFGQGNRNSRLTVPEGPAEIRHLVEAFNGMAQTIQTEEEARIDTEESLLDHERQLRSMAAQTVLAEERERKRIAAGLHDEAGPLLASCYMKLGRALQATEPQRVAAAVSECRGLIDLAVTALRSLTFDLSSPTLHAFGLLAALDQLCQELARRHGLDIEFRGEGEGKWGAGQEELVVYRAARELLFNVIKHAAATRVTVMGRYDEKGIFLSIVDDGAGFDATGAGAGFSQSGGFGLFSVHERIEAMGGSFQIASSPGAGTRAAIRIDRKA